MSERAEIDVHLRGLEPVWEEGMGDAYAFYRLRAPAEVALAAAMVESGLQLQRLGGQAPDAPRLLLGDLCLARASRLLAETRDQRLQVGFAQAVERTAAAAAGGPPAPPLRDLLTATIADAR
ncbi:MAG TPA: hypothetical protein VFD49_05150 [Candidatus Dormibacteraeota bacterium]|nr:hypothetical protein [Candidatus Dormibacteraeota bacterium]